MRAAWQKVSYFLNDMGERFRNQQPLHLPDNRYRNYLCELDLVSFPFVHDFTVKLKKTNSFGFQLYFHSDSLGRLASFPWWDNVEKDLVGYMSNNIPVGNLQLPFDDLEQSWQIVIFEHEDYVYIMQGMEPCCIEFFAWFKVPRTRYFEEWSRVIRQFNPAA